MSHFILRNLPLRISQSELSTVLSEYLTEYEVKLNFDHCSGLSLGSALLALKTETDKGLILTSDITIYGKKLIVVKLDSVENLSKCSPSENKVCISSLHPKTTQEDIRSYFSKFGTLQTAQVFYETINCSKRASWASIAFRDTGASHSQIWGDIQHQTHSIRG